jgi:hypothetical protein
MSEQNVIAIDAIHSRAICDEIGERLRVSHLPIASELPPRLQNLLDCLREQELEDSPTIAPSIADLSYGECCESYEAKRDQTVPGVEGNLEMATERLRKRDRFAGAIMLAMSEPCPTLRKVKNLTV